MPDMLLRVDRLKWSVMHLGLNKLKAKNLIYQAHQSAHSAGEEFGENWIERIQDETCHVS